MTDTDAATRLAMCLGMDFDNYEVNKYSRLIRTQLKKESEHVADSIVQAYLVGPSSRGELVTAIERVLCGSK